jgi:hypothetical protein
MTSIDAITRPPDPQDFGTTSPVTLTPLFEVLDEACECRTLSSTNICCAGCWAPCCLLGSTKAMALSDFKKVVQPCDGCSGVCCAYYSADLFFGAHLPFIGHFISGCVGLYCVRGPRLGHYVTCQDCVDYAFCPCCAACADYKTALLRVQAGRQK